MKLIHLVLTIVLFSLALLPLGWFSGKQLLLGYDNVYPVNPVAFLQDRVYSWTTTQNFGMDQSGIQGSLFIHALDSLPHFMGADVQTSQKIVFVLWFFLLLLSPYIFVRTLEKHNLIKASYLRYFFPLLYAVNFYILQAWWIAERTKFSLVVATPLLLSFLVPLLVQNISRKEIIRRALGMAFTLSIFNGGGWMGLSLYGGLFVALGTFYVFFIYRKLLVKDVSNIVRFHVLLILFGVFFFSLNAYTFFPFIFRTLSGYKTLLAAAGGISGQVSWSTYLSENTSFINLLRLQGIPDWYNNGINHPYSSVYLQQPLFILAGFLFPVLLFLALLRAKKERTPVHTYMLLLLIVALFFTAGSHAPLGVLFDLFLKRIPGFLIFRSPVFKFGYAYWLAATYFVGLGLAMTVESVLSKIARIRMLALSRWPKLAFPAVVMVLLVLYHFPYLTGDFFRNSAASFASRSEIPQYVFDFSQWWARDGGGKRILLLPKLNDNWLFEQYRWKYLSLFPLLGNFGNTGMVENLDNLVPAEQRLIGILYQAIEKRDYGVMDAMSDILGVQYFLVRRDFYYDFPDQEAVKPEVLEDIVLHNPRIVPIVSFGQWSVYGYRDEKLAIRSVTNDRLILADAEKALSLRDTVPYDLFLSDEIIDTIPDAERFPVTLYPACLSCKAEKEQIAVQFPQSRILPDSPLYPLVEWKNNFLRSRKTGESLLFSLLGESLKSSSEFTYFINRGQSPYIALVAEKYGKILDEILQTFDSVSKQSGNPYVLSDAIYGYISSQVDNLSTYIFVTKKDDQPVIQSVLAKLVALLQKTKTYFTKKDFDRKKIYGVTVTSPGTYAIQTDREQSLEKVLIDGSGASTSAFLSEGKHRLELDVDLPQNLMQAVAEETIADNSCFASIVEPYDSGRFYRLRFVVEKPMGKRSFFFVDTGGSFAPIIYSSLTESTNEGGDFDYTIVPGMVAGIAKPQKLRVAFCAPVLTREMFDASIKRASFTEIVEPNVRLKKLGTLTQITATPRLTFEMLNPTLYRIHVREASAPFFLVLNQRHDQGWKVRVLGSDADVSEDLHLLGNTYNNVWFIENTGDIDLTLTYEPQKFFVYGVWVSGISLLAGFLVYVNLTRRKETNER